MVALVGAALIGYAPPASAKCDVTVSFRNDGATSQTFFLHYARTRMQGGTWVHMWRKAVPTLLAPGRSATLIYPATACSWLKSRAFEFHIDPAACGPSAPSDAWWLTGGGNDLGLRKLLNRELPPAGTTIKIRVPYSGFARQDTLHKPDSIGWAHDGGPLLVDLGDLHSYCPPYVPAP